jgi:hypothetical protein
MSHDSQATLIGSIGVTILLVAFFLNLIKRLRVESFLYAALNVVGASVACYSSYMIRFMPFVVLEATWAVVSLVAIVRMLFSARRVDETP